MSTDPHRPLSRRRAGRLALATAAAALLLAPAAGAAVPDFLVKSPEDGLSGSGAGQMNLPWGIAADPNLPGDLYIADHNNQRISVLTPWGQFVRAWGWGVDDGSSEPQVCTAESGCQAGLAGGGAGQFNFPEAIAVDPAGDVYVIEGENHRVQKFDSAGNFILTFGFKVNKTKEAGSEAEANLCTKASGDTCQAGSPGTGPGRIGEGFPLYTAGLAISPTDGTVFVSSGQQERIDAFNPNGTFKEAIELPERAEAIAADAGGDLYGGLVKPSVEGHSVREIRKLKPHGPTAEFLGPAIVLDTSKVVGLALGVAGNLYAAIGNSSKDPGRKVLEFDPAGKCLNCGSEGEDGKEGFDRVKSPDLIFALATGSACGPTDVYVGHFNGASQSFFNIWGEPPTPALCPPPPIAPEITAQYALSADTTSAALQAQINPQFWPDTTYYLEYGTGPCFEGGCTATPEPPGALLTSKTIKTPLKTSTLNLEGLAPDTTYHYRFVAESSGGGPTVGLSGKSGAQAEGTFTTYEKPVPESCPANEAFRDGPAALLPDCRAYELVSPLDKNNADIEVLPEFRTELPSTLDQSSVNGDKLAYGSATAFGDAPSGAYTSQYIATRGEKEWKSHSITPMREEIVLDPARTFDTEVKVLSPDLCESWIRTVAEPIFAPAAPPGFANLYRRTDDECGGPSFEALTTVAPNLSGVEATPDLELQGLSGDGESAIYVLYDSLEGTEAPPQPDPKCLEKNETGFCKSRLYLQEPGEGLPHYVCVLPDGTPLTGSCSAGGPGLDQGAFRLSNLQNAISADGSRVFWTAFATSPGPGQIYVRENPGRAPERPRRRRQVHRTRTRLHDCGLKRSRRTLGDERIALLGSRGRWLKGDLHQR